MKITERGGWLIFGNEEKISRVSCRGYHLLHLTKVKNPKTPKFTIIVNKYQYSCVVCTKKISKKPIFCEKKLRKRGCKSQKTMLYYCCPPNRDNIKS